MQKFSPTKSNNRLLIVDWASLAYQSMFGLSAECKRKEKRGEMGLTHVNNFGMDVDLTRPDSTIKALRNSILSRVIDLVNTFRPNAIMFTLEGVKNWRFEFYPQYKANRVFADWPFVITKSQFSEESMKVSYDIAKMFNAHVVRNLNCEGDDVVAVATKHLYSRYETVTLASSDKDLVQLIKYGNVEVYDLRTGTYRDCESSAKFFLESKILMGDPSDNIPGIVLPGKKKALGKTTAPRLVAEHGGAMYEAAEQNGWLESYMFNRTLIDMDYIPLELESEILELIRNSRCYEYNYMDILDADFTGMNMQRYSSVTSPVMTVGAYQWNI